MLEREVKPASLKLVLLILANYASDTGMAYPSTETIIRKTNVSRTSVVAALDSLVKQGWLEDTGKRVGRTKQIKVYRLRWADEQPKDTESEPLKDAKTEPFDAEKGSEIAAKGSKTEPLRVRKLNPEPSEELSRNGKRNQLSKFIEFLIEDPRFDGLDVEGEVARAVEWYKKKIARSLSGFWRIGYFTRSNLWKRTKMRWARWPAKITSPGMVGLRTEGVRFWSFGLTRRSRLCAGINFRRT